MRPTSGPRAARALSERDVLFHHAFRNALLPIVTLLGLSLPALVGGAYFVEYVFSIPGVGYLTFSSIFCRDYPTLMAITMLTAVLIVAGNLLADVAYAIVDPRIRYELMRACAAFPARARRGRRVRPSSSSSSSPRSSARCSIRISPIAIDHALIGQPQPPSSRTRSGTDLHRPRRASRATLYGARVSLLVGGAAMAGLVRHRDLLRRDRRRRRRGRRQPDDALRRRDALVPDVLLAADHRRADRTVLASGSSS